MDSLGIDGSQRCRARTKSRSMSRYLFGQSWPAGTWRNGYGKNRGSATHCSCLCYVHGFACERNVTSVQMRLLCRPATDAEYWVVVDRDTGRIVAQGGEAMCRVIEKFGPHWIEKQGDLFDGTFRI